MLLTQRRTVRGAYPGWVRPSARAWPPQRRGERREGVREDAPARVSREAKFSPNPRTGVFEAASKQSEGRTFRRADASCIALAFRFPARSRRHAQIVGGAQRAVDGPSG